MKFESSRKGFTLIELLVVIAIIAVLAVVVILSLNPAELLRQARDSNRVSDMATLKSALSLYLADQVSPKLTSSTQPGNTYGYVYFSQTNAPTLSLATSGFSLSDFSSGSTTGTSSRAVNATGWIPVNFSAITSGSPLGSLPLDPTNSTSSVAQIGGSELIYGYAATSSGTSFKLTATMESLKYATGTADVENNDGGNSALVYEQGSNPTL